MTESKMLFTLKNGEQKWMTKREYRNYKKRLEALKSVYDQYVEVGFIDPNLDIIDQVHQVVDLGVELMGLIGYTADKISISGIHRVQNEVNKKISKEDFTQMVKHVAAHLDQDVQQKDNDKFTAKLLKDIDEAIYKINLKRTFFTNFNDLNEIMVPKESKEIIFPRLSEEKNKRFNEIVKSCAKARNYLDTKLWPQYKEYASLAEYITQGDLTYERYKKLVDYKYYTGDEDPRFQNQDKRWEKMVSNFLYVYRLCKKYDYDYFHQVEEEVLGEMEEDILDEVA